MHDLVRFHLVHGSGVVLSEDSSLATRNAGDYFSNGIVFSSQPLKPGQRVCLELTQASEWSGAIRIGVTTEDPGKLSQASLPKYLCPDLTERKGYWAKGLSESLAETGNRVMIYVNREGEMHYFVNSEHRGVFLRELPVDETMWAVLDIYGNTTAAKIVKAASAPVEIVARGQDALQAYQYACEAGTQPVFRTRLMLVGEDGVGKTTLKKALLGIRADPDEEMTDGIDLSASCSFNLSDRQAWRRARQRLPSESEETWRHNMKDAESGGRPVRDSEAVIDHTAEYHEALAANIVQELLYRQKQEGGSRGQETGANKADSHGPNIHKADSHKADSHKADSHKADSHKADSHKTQAVRPNTKPSNVKTASPSPRLQISPSDPKYRDLLQQVPDPVVHLVQKKLKAKTSPSVLNNKTGSGRNIELSIWDFAGQTVYYTTHQVFLSSRAVYVIVFNLCQDLDSPAKLDDTLNRGTQSDDSLALDEFSHLDYMDYWMNSIHVHTSQNHRDSLHNTALSPPVFIVGTHRGGLSEDPSTANRLQEEWFKRIQGFIQGKPYERHVITHFYAVENGLEELEDPEVSCLRRHIEDTASRETYMGEEIPLKWLQFELAVAQLVERDTTLCSLDQIRELCLELGITSESELSTLLSFYHDLGTLIYMGGGDMLDSALNNLVIVQPSWLVSMVSKVITASPPETENSKQVDQWRRLCQMGVLEDELLDSVWPDTSCQKSALLGLMDKFDLLCVCKPTKQVSSRRRPRPSYYVPACIQKPQSPSVQLYHPHKQDVIFYFNFHGFLPDGLFHRLVTRCIRWSQRSGSHEPQLLHRQAHFYLDTEHDFILQMAPVHTARVKVVVQRMCEVEEETQSIFSDQSGEKRLPPPKPASVAKVRHFLETSLSDLRETWMKRISYEACVRCSCEKQCNLHDKENCDQQQCLHFLNLDECITNKIVCCEHRRIKTAQYRKWFPSPVPTHHHGPILPDSSELRPADCDPSQSADLLPVWVKSAAKLLNGGSDNQDWSALARKLGYKKSKMDQFNEDFNPGLAVLTDWIVSSGNTTLSVDMLVTLLEQMQREDVVEVVQKAQEAELEPPQVFLSYQWDTQDEVSLLRERLESAGYSCWMDIGQMGGGDLLYSRIDEGIRNAKVVIACLSPKYIVSHYCNRELHLADLLRKPLIPVVFEKVPWPPPGAMALIFSQLVFINMNGVGGHGGGGIHADTEDKYREIIQKVSCHAQPVLKPQIDLSPVREVRQPPEFFQMESSILSGSSFHHGNSPPYSYQGSPDHPRAALPRQQQQQHRSPAHATQAAPGGHHPSYGEGRGGRRNTSARQNEATGSDQVGVEQVAVSNCAVCVIL